MASYSSCDSGSGFPDELVRRAEQAEQESARLNNLADLDWVLACVRQIGNYLEKARETQDDGLQHEYLALSQHLVRSVEAALTADAA